MDSTACIFPSKPISSGIFQGVPLLSCVVQEREKRKQQEREADKAARAAKAVSEAVVHVFCSLIHNVIELHASTAQSTVK